MTLIKNMYRTRKMCNLVSYQTYSIHIFYQTHRLWDNDFYSFFTFFFYLMVIFYKSTKLYNTSISNSLFCQRDHSFSFSISILSLISVHDPEIDHIIQCIWRMIWMTINIHYHFLFMHKKDYFLLLLYYYVLLLYCA